MHLTLLLNKWIVGLLVSFEHRHLCIFALGDIWITCIACFC